MMFLFYYLEQTWVGRPELQLEPVPRSQPRGDEWIVAVVNQNLWGGGCIGRGFNLNKPGGSPSFCSTVVAYR